MAKISRIERNNTRRKESDRSCEKRCYLRKQSKNKNLTMSQRMVFQKKLRSMKRDSSPTRVRNRCALTGNPRSCFRIFGLSRSVFRKLACEGLLPGVIKISM